MLNLRLAAPGHLIDINRVEGFPPLRMDNGALEVGACVRQREVEVAALTRSSVPILENGLRFVGHRGVRDRGTVVGSIAHADPAAELPALLLLLGGAVTVDGPSGSRSIPANTLYRSAFETTLTKDELAVSVSFPSLDPGTGWAFDEITRRQGDFALCGAAAIVNEATAQLVLFGIDTVPRLFDLSAFSRGEATLQECMGDLAPMSDVHASADFRRHLAFELGNRVVQRAGRRRDLSMEAGIR